MEFPKVEGFFSFMTLMIKMVPVCDYRYLLQIR